MEIKDAAGKLVDIEKNDAKTIIKMHSDLVKEIKNKVMMLSISHQSKY